MIYELECKDHDVKACLASMLERDGNEWRLPECVSVNRVIVNDGLVMASENGKDFSPVFGLNVDGKGIDIRLIQEYFGRR